MLCAHIPYMHAGPTVQAQISLGRQSAHLNGNTFGIMHTVYDSYYTSTPVQYMLRRICTDARTAPKLRRTSCWGLGHARTSDLLIF